MCVASLFFGNPTISLLTIFSRLRGMIAETHRKSPGKPEHQRPALRERAVYEMVTNRLLKDYKLIRKGVTVGTGAGLTGFIRKRKSHDGPAIDFALDCRRAAVTLGDGFHQGQAQTCPLRAAR